MYVALKTQVKQGKNLGLCLRDMNIDLAYSSLA